jgi:signal transduction histidine kinase
MMTPLKEWLKPPRSLLIILFLLTLVSVSSLGWFGWKLLEQERVVEAQRAQDRVEQAADRIAATMRGTLAETGERLGAWVTAPPPAGKPEEGLLLTLTENSMAAFPADRLLYRPFAPPEAEAPAMLFAVGEALEFQESQPDKALEWYRGRVDSKDAAVRAGALLRMGRVLRRTGPAAEAVKVYGQLAAMAGVRVAGAPASLVGRHALCELLGRPSDAEALMADLQSARWPLTKGQFEFYWAESARLLGRPVAPPAEAVALAEAASLAWAQRKNEPVARGQGTVWVDRHPLFLMWRGSGGRRAVLVTRPETMMKEVAAGSAVLFVAVDGEGRTLAGRKQGAARAAVRTAAESQLPWTLYVTGTQSALDAGMLTRQRFLLLGLLVMVLFLMAGTYFIARAIRREMEVSRMQSDFVSAVSHEFRSPLTSIRQLSEILALGRVPSEERRQVYYETLVRETSRLQRLVESLLNFGRMEAGARQYRFEELEAATLVERVVAEFAPQIAPAGRQIEVHGAGSRCALDGDPEAISVALRNLVDNALKYSPNCPTVWVEWETENEYVAIRVRDRGAGIAASERKAIFRKFVRGTASVAGNVKGSGVGLAMVRHIVAAHGGVIKVASEPGQGSTFTMLLPAAAGRT